MNNIQAPYKETHRLPVNVYLFFYGYVLLLIFVSNLLTPSALTYFIYLIAGIAGISILLVRYTYTILIKEDKMILLIKVPFTIKLFTLNINDIAAAEKTAINSFSNKDIVIKKDAGIYAFKKAEGIKLIMRDRRTLILSGFNADKIISLVNK